MISDNLKKNISGIVEKIRKIERFLTENPVLSPAQISQVSYSCTEIALLSFAVYDDIAHEDNIGDRLLQREFSSALWQIALHCIEVQDWAEAIMLESHIRMIGKHCTGLIHMLGLPEPVLENALVARAPDDMLPVSDMPLQAGSPPGKSAAGEDIDARLLFEQEACEEDASLSLIIAPPVEDEIERLKIEIKALREILSSLVLRRDSLLLVESKELEALYMKELGSLEAEVYQAESTARYFQRKYEMMQAAVNRQEAYDTVKIEADLKEQYEAYKKVYEDFIRKAREAAESVRKRRDNVKNSSEGLGKDCSEESKDDASEETSGESRAEKDAPEESKDKRLKKLYRKIVKAMHPDLHPDQDEKTKELFKRAMRAYEEGDLQTMEEIDQILGGTSPEENEDILAALLEERKRLLALIQGIRAQIGLILGRYPFTKKELLNDPVRLEAEQNKLRKRLEQAKQRAASYQVRIEEMEEHGRSDSET